MVRRAIFAIALLGVRTVDASSDFADLQGGQLGHCWKVGPRVDVGLRNKCLVYNVRTRIKISYEVQCTDRV